MPTVLLVVDCHTRQVVAQASDPNLWLEPQHRLIEAPDTFQLEQADDWYWDGEHLIYDAEVALAQAKDRAIAKIKQHAALLLNDSDWKLQRAQEREKAGWSTLADTATVLAEREAIRQSSNAAEQRLQALTTRDAVDAFTWQVDVPIAAPRLLTQKQFADRFTDSELALLIQSAKNSPEMATWFERFHAAKDLNLDAPLAQEGVRMLEAVGLIAQGRANEILH